MKKLKRMPVMMSTDTLEKETELKEFDGMTKEKRREMIIKKAVESKLKAFKAKMRQPGDIAERMKVVGDDERNA